MNINLLERYIQLTFPDLNFKMENVERIQIEDSELFYGYKKIYFKLYLFVLFCLKYFEILTLNLK